MLTAHALISSRAAGATLAGAVWLRAPAGGLLLDTVATERAVVRAQLYNDLARLQH